MIRRNNPSFQIKILFIIVCDSNKETKNIINEKKYK